MKKKNIITAILLTALVAGCIAILVLLMPKKLPRDTDAEFVSGSPVRIEELSEQQTESLYKICKVWGYVKYYHPSVIDGTLNWDAELLRVMPKVLEADTGKAADTVLTAWLAAFPIEETKDAAEAGSEWVKLQEKIGFSALDTSWISSRNFLGEDLCTYLETLSHIAIADRSNAYAAFDNRSPYVNFDNESQSEFTIMALRQSPNAVVIGSPSIGADGNVVTLALPGGIRFAITGLGIYTPDGGQTQRSGLQPDVECYPTIEGVRDGRDELVEKAIETILQ